MNFKEYYQYYLTLHKNKNNRRLHVLGQTFTILYAILCMTSLPLVMILFAPFIVYPFAWTGHIYFEKNEPAAWSNPFWAKACDWIMLKDMIIGKVKR